MVELVRHYIMHYIKSLWFLYIYPLFDRQPSNFSVKVCPRYCFVNLIALYWATINLAVLISQALHW